MCFIVVVPYDHVTYDTNKEINLIGSLSDITFLSRKRTPYKS